MNDIIVTKRSHPLLFEALETISHDRGSGSGHSNYGIPIKWQEHLEVTERALKTLDEKDYEEFLIGERTIVEVIGQRSSDLTLAHEFLDAFFEDFEEEE